MLHVITKVKPRSDQVLTLQHSTGNYSKYLKTCKKTLKKKAILYFWENFRNNKQVQNDHIINPYPTAFPYGNGMVLHFYQQQESSTTKTVHKVINKGLKTYV